MSNSDTETDQKESVSADYDPEAPLEERLPIIAEMEGGVEIHVRDGDRDVVEIVHQPQHFRDTRHAMQLDCGPRPDAWEWEIVVPKSDNDPVLKKVDPNQPSVAYQATKRTWLTDIDVRVYGIDVDRWLTEAEA